MNIRKRKGGRAASLRAGVFFAWLPLLGIAAGESRGLWPDGQTPFFNPADEETGYPRLHSYPAPEPSRNGAAVVIAPGGGYRGLATDHEGHQIARWMNERGVSAFVLHYRLGAQGNHYPTQLADVQRALRLVRSEAERHGIDRDRIGVMGFSAGGHLASMAATLFGNEVYEPVDEIDDESARPDFAVLGYPVISMDREVTHAGSRRNLLGPQAEDAEAARRVSSERNVTPETPPTFLFHTGEDEAVPAENSIRFFLALRKNGVPCELHVYQQGPHGVGLFQGDPVLGTWSERLEDWLRSNGFFTAAVRRVAVKGTVILDGVPVSWGTLTFHPEKDGVPVTTVRIRRGRFQAPPETGPAAGPSRLTFSGSIWEETRDPADGVAFLDARSPDSTEPITVEVREGMEPLDVAFRTE